LFSACSEAPAPLFPSLRRTCSADLAIIPFFSSLPPNWSCPPIFSLFYPPLPFEHRPTPTASFPGRILLKLLTLQTRRCASSSHDLGPCCELCDFLPFFFRHVFSYPNNFKVFFFPRRSSHTPANISSRRPADVAISSGLHCLSFSRLSNCSDATPSRTPTNHATAPDC